MITKVRKRTRLNEVHKTVGTAQLITGHIRYSLQGVSYHMTTTVYLMGETFLMSFLVLSLEP